MPDGNKFAKLREIGYTLPITCGLCVMGEFPDRGDWGTCKIHRYQHLKHTGESRGVSIHRGGSCADAEVDGSKVMAASFGAHLEFLDGTLETEGE